MLSLVTISRAPAHSGQRFEHYELIIGEDGRPVELRRGAMGITYKAVDVHLRCFVTLKVISGKYLGDESARLRFLREARAAASVRHPNAGSVFHLGGTDENFFYAMEFVEGVTLENLIRRSSPFEAKDPMRQKLNRIITGVLCAMGDEQRRELSNTRAYTSTVEQKRLGKCWKPWKGKSQRNGPLC